MATMIGDSFVGRLISTSGWGGGVSMATMIGCRGGVRRGGQGIRLRDGDGQRIIVRNF